MLCGSQGLLFRRILRGILRNEDKEVLRHSLQAHLYLGSIVALRRVDRDSW